MHQPWEPGPPAGKSWFGPSAFGRQLETCNTASCQRRLTRRRSDEAILGVVTLSQIFRGAFDNAIMGCWIGAPHAERGNASEGVRLCLRRAFTALGGTH